MSSKKIIGPKDAYVLVVEDNMQNMILISRLLDFIGVKRYEWKASGWQMLDVVEDMPRIDLILLDLHLPHEDGFEVLSNVRGDPRLADTRVVAVTADINPETMNKAKKAEFDGFLGKPIDPERFPQQVTDILQGKTIWSIDSFDTL